MISVNKKRKERDTTMTFDKSIACDLDDLIFGSATLVPSEIGRASCRERV